MTEAASGRFAHLVDADRAEVLELMGTTAQFLTDPEDDAAPCIIRGTIPPGMVVPLHSHPDPETFIAVAGEIEGFSDAARWLRIRPGGIFHVPGGARHAFRNRGTEPAVSIVVTTPHLGRFFQEVARTLGAGPPSADKVRRFLEIARRYGHWNASPGQNAEIGISLPTAT